MVEFQYFDGCPNADETIANLLELVKDGIISENDITVTVIPDIETAKKLNFLGSPTILINNIDIYTEETPKTFRYSCRIYEFNGKKTGIIPKDFIAKQILKLLNKR